VRSKVWVCGRFIAEIAGSNPTESMEVRPSSLSCCVGSRPCDDLISPSEFYCVCLCVCVCCLCVCACVVCV
jgi:hypothetical protein